MREGKYKKSQMKINSSANIKQDSSENKNYAHVWHDDKKNVQFIAAEVESFFRRKSNSNVFLIIHSL
jgi:hypothetical protein